MKRVLCALVLILFTLFFAVGGAAAAYLDFNIAPPTTGTISWGASTNYSVVGTGISVDTVILDGVEGTSHNIVGGVLNFTTGAGSSFSNGILSLTGGPGTSIVLKGSIPDFGISDTNTVLMQGYFTRSTVLQVVSIDFAPGIQFNIDILGGGFIDTKNETLLNWYETHYAQNWGPNWMGGVNLQFSAMAVLVSGQVTSFQSIAMNSGDITNYNSVPVPASLLLLGSGMVGLLAFGRRKYFSKA